MVEEREFIQKLLDLELDYFIKALTELKEMGKTPIIEGGVSEAILADIMATISKIMIDFDMNFRRLKRQQEGGEI